MRISNNEKGYTMIEAIMYISLLIILSASLATNISKVMTRYKTGRVAQQVIDLKKAIISYTAVSDNYLDVDRDKMIEHNAMPLDMSTGYHALNGEILAGCVESLTGGTSASGTSNDKYMFYFTFKGLSKSSCIEILTQGQFYGDGSEMDTLIVNDQYGWRFQYSLYPHRNMIPYMKEITKTEGTAPGIYISIGDAMEACSLPHNNYITWIFS